MTRLPARSRKLYRSDEKIIAGVSAGLADYFGVPKLLIRILFLALLVVGPGLPLYVLFWIVTPRDPGDGYVVRGGLSLRLAFLLGIMAAVGVALLIASQASFAGSGLFVLGFVVGLMFLIKGRSEEGLEEITVDHQFLVDESVTYTVKLGTEKKVAGVCAYLSDKTGMDVTLVRVLAIILSFFTFPIVPILYLVGAFVLPKQEKLRIH